MAGQRNMDWMMIRYGYERKAVLDNLRAELRSTGVDGPEMIENLVTSYDARFNCPPVSERNINEDNI